MSIASRTIHQHIGQHSLHAKHVFRFPVLRPAQEEKKAKSAGENLTPLAQKAIAILDEEAKKNVRRLLPVFCRLLL